MELRWPATGCNTAAPGPGNPLADPAPHPVRRHRPRLRHHRPLAGYTAPDPSRLAEHGAGLCVTRRLCDEAPPRWPAPASPSAWP